jgi:hypothetical protein
MGNPQKNEKYNNKIAQYIFLRFCDDRVSRSISYVAGILPIRKSDVAIFPLKKTKEII